MSKFIVCHYNPHTTEHKHNHVTLNFTMIMSQFAWPFLPVVDLFFEVARTFQSYKASLMLAYLDTWGAYIVCTLLAGAIETGLTPYSSEWLFGSFRS